MKLLLSFAATLIVVFCVAAIVALVAFGHVVPTVIPAVALGALAGTYALLVVPSWGELVVVLAVVVGLFILALLSKTIPASLTELLVVALTGHFALSLPAPLVVSSAAAVPAAAKVVEVVRAPAPVAATAADPPMIGGA